MRPIVSNCQSARFWNAYSSFGQQPVFTGPEDLWVAAQEYFDWVEDHPLCLEKGFSYQGKVMIKGFSKMRAMSIGGLCLFLRISREDFEAFGINEHFAGVKQLIESVIFEQKFAGAAAELLSPALIVRDLGLSDRKEMTGRDGGAIETSQQEFSAHDLALRLFALVSEGQKQKARADVAGNEAGLSEKFGHLGGKEFARRYKSRNEDNGNEVTYQEVCAVDAGVCGNVTE